MMKINEDRFTNEDLATTISVIRHLEDQSAVNSETNNKQILRTVRLMIRNYEEQSEWRQERPGDRVDLSNNTTLSGCVGDSSDE